MYINVLAVRMMMQKLFLVFKHNVEGICMVMLWGKRSVDDSVSFPLEGQRRKETSKSLEL
jgi:hypothetical protein